MAKSVKWEKQKRWKIYEREIIWKRRDMEKEEIH